MTAFGVEPYGQPKYLEIAGKRMAYIDEGRVTPSSFSTATPRRLTCGATSCRTWKGWAGWWPAI